LKSSLISILKLITQQAVFNAEKWKLSWVDSILITILVTNITLFNSSFVHSFFWLLISSAHSYVKCATRLVLLRQHSDKKYRNANMRDLQLEKDRKSSIIITIIELIDELASTFYTRIWG